MQKKILIDYLQEGNYSIITIDQDGKITDCGFENQEKQSIRGNIYLGQITRVEHSLQAVFVKYTDKNIGFLPFSEIHPDYYQIPNKDKEDLTQKIKEEDLKNIENNENIDNKNENYELYKQYKVQEVMKRGQNILVQVTRDERGVKGATLSSYISLAGHYCVFMPNSPRGIGVSKKIENFSDRRKILSIIKKFNIPFGTGLVVRTAGLLASESQLKQDYQYLTKLWTNIGQKIITSNTGDMIHEECDVIEQYIRDNYKSEETSQIIVSNPSGFNKIKDFIKKINPGEEKKVILYNEILPIYRKYGVDKQINELIAPRVNLPSGGYLVIHQTEALVAIDVNSGKLNNEKNIEETAIKTNLEAATEVARQLRLRNLGGLIVVDFIDMLELEHRKEVEKVLQTSFTEDKAKIQFTRISIFGLVEISRQRIKSSIVDIMSIPCSKCQGTGYVKSNNVIAVDIIENILTIMRNPKIIKKKYLIVESSENINQYLSKIYKNNIENIENKNKIQITFKNIIFHDDTEFKIKMSDDLEGSINVHELYQSILDGQNNNTKKNNNFLKKIIYIFKFAFKK